jgi:hypothetical protein
VFLKYLLPPSSGNGDVGCRLLPNVGKFIPMNLLFPVGEDISLFNAPRQVSGAHPIYQIDGKRGKVIGGMKLISS